MVTAPSCHARAECFAVPRANASRRCGCATTRRTARRARMSFSHAHRPTAIMDNLAAANMFSTRPTAYHRTTNVIWSWIASTEAMSRSVVSWHDMIRWRCITIITIFFSIPKMPTRRHSLRSARQRDRRQHQWKGRRSVRASRKEMWWILRLSEWKRWRRLHGNVVSIGSVSMRQRCTLYRCGFEVQSQKWLRR